MLKLIRSMRVTRLLIASLGIVIQPLVATLGLLSFILYVAALGFGQPVLEYMVEHQEDLSSELVEMYGSPWHIMLTLLAACVGGADWIAILRPFRDIGSWLVPIFICVVVFVIFGLANLLTALLTDHVFKKSKREERMMISEAWKEQRSAINCFKELLLESGKPPNGEISRRIVSRAIKSDEGQQILKDADLEPVTALGLLKLLDTEDLGTVVLEEYLCSLNQLQGDNLSVHLATNMHESKKILRSIAQVRLLLQTTSHAPKSVPSGFNLSTRT
jgi:hypothetical protein